MWPQAWSWAGRFYKVKDQNLIEMAEQGIGECKVWMLTTLRKYAVL